MSQGKITFENLKEFAKCVKTQVDSSTTLEPIAGISNGLPDPEDEMVTPGSLWLVSGGGILPSCYFVRVVADEEGNKSIEVPGAPYNEPRNTSGNISGGGIMLTANDGSLELDTTNMQATAGRMYSYLSKPAVVIDMQNTTQLFSLSAYQADQIDPLQEATVKVESLIRGFNIPRVITLDTPYGGDNEEWKNVLTTYPTGTIARYCSSPSMGQGMYQYYKISAFKRVNGSHFQRVWEDLTEEVLCANDSGSLELITPQENSSVPSTSSFTLNLVEAQRILDKAGDGQLFKQLAQWFPYLEKMELVEWDSDKDPTEKGIYRSTATGEYFVMDYERKSGRIDLVSYLIDSLRMDSIGKIWEKAGELAGKHTWYEPSTSYYLRPVKDGELDDWDGGVALTEDAAIEYLLNELAPKIVSPVIEIRNDATELTEEQILQLNKVTGTPQLLSGLIFRYYIEGVQNDSLWIKPTLITQSGDNWEIVATIEGLGGITLQKKDGEWRIA